MLRVNIDHVFCWDQIGDHVAWTRVSHPGDARRFVLLDLSLVFSSSLVNPGEPANILIQGGAHFESHFTLGLPGSNLGPVSIQWAAHCSSADHRNRMN